MNKIRLHSRPAINTAVYAAMMSGVALAAIVATPTAALAQAPAQTTAAQQPTVLKNRAPVDKSILHVELPRPKEFTLPLGTADAGGARVLVVENHKLPLVTITVSVRAGTLFDNPQKPGVAALTATLLTTATTTRSFDQISSETAKIGASLGAEAGLERATVSVSGLAENTDELVDLLADVLEHPAFPVERLTRAKFQEVSRLSTQQTNAQYLAAQLTRQILYGRDSPYGRPASTANQIKAVSVDDLRAYYSQYYTNGPTVLIGVAGDVKAKDIFEKLKKSLVAWQTAPAASASSALPSANFVPKDKTAVYLVDRPGSAQTYISFSNIGIRRTDPDFFPLQIANYILGGSFNSRLNTDLREQKGYTYGVRSTLTTGKYPGIWEMGGAVRNAVTAPALAGFYSEFDLMQSAPVTQAELDAAKRSIVGSFALTLENPSLVLGRLIEVVDYGLPADYWDKYPERIQAVTADDVLRVTKQYLGTGRIQLIAVGERAAIEKGLSNYGPVQVLIPEQIMNPAGLIAPPAAGASASAHYTPGQSTTKP